MEYDPYQDAMAGNQERAIRWLRRFGKKVTVHNAHVGKPDTAVLADGCERCDEHAMRPFDQLDDNNLCQITKLAINHETEGHTYNDIAAAVKIEQVIQQYNHLLRIGAI